MNQFERFQEALKLKSTENNKFTVNPDTNYFVGNTPHGGYLMALMHKALCINAIKYPPCGVLPTK